MTGGCGSSATTELPALHPPVQQLRQAEGAHRQGALPRADHLLRLRQALQEQIRHAGAQEQVPPTSLEGGVSQCGFP